MTTLFVGLFGCCLQKKNVNPQILCHQYFRVGKRDPLSARTFVRLGLEIAANVESLLGSG